MRRERGAHGIRPIGRVRGRERGGELPPGRVPYSLALTEAETGLTWTGLSPVLVTLILTLFLPLLILMASPRQTTAPARLAGE